MRELLRLEHGARAAVETEAEEGVYVLSFEFFFVRPFGVL